MREHCLCVDGSAVRQENSATLSGELQFALDEVHRGAECCSPKSLDDCSSGMVSVYVEVAPHFVFAPIQSCAFVEFFFPVILIFGTELQVRHQLSEYAIPYGEMFFGRDENE